MDIADRLFKAIEDGDVEAVRALYAPDAVIWHNVDGVEQDVTDNLRVLGWMASAFKARAYTDVRRSSTDDGFVQLHVHRRVSRFSSTRSARWVRRTRWKARTPSSSCRGSTTSPSSARTWLAPSTSTRTSSACPW